MSHPVDQVCLVEFVVKISNQIVLTVMCLAKALAHDAIADELKTARPTRFQHGVVAAEHAAASEARARILREGGNVVDAAVATSFALSVVRPASCGIGGGGFMVIWDAKAQKAIALDYRERAPANVSASDYLDAADSRGAEPASVRGGKAVGVPGNVAGLCYAAEKYGTLPLRQLPQPALDLCHSGVEIDQHDVEAQAAALRTIRSHGNYDSHFARLYSCGNRSAQARLR